MSAGGFAIRYSGEGRRELKRLAPTPYVDVGDEVAESVDEGRDVLGDFDFFGAAKEGPIEAAGDERGGAEESESVHDKREGERLCCVSSVR